MTTATISAHVHAVPAAAPAELRLRRNAAHVALLAFAALFVAQALRMAADAGPMHLFELVFFLGGVALAVVMSWMLPFAGMLLTAAFGGAAWLFLDAQPANWILGLAGLGTSLLLARAWITQRASAG